MVRLCRTGCGGVEKSRVLLMHLMDVVWHLSDFSALPLLLGMISAAVAKWWWRADLLGVSWCRLSSRAVAASWLACAAALVVMGSDGHMVSYAAMVCACAASIGWCARSRR
jgi:hypothetical protein